MAMNSDMIRNRRNGASIIQWVVALLLIGFVAIVTVYVLFPPQPQRPGHGIANKGRGIWVAVVSANSERAPAGKGAVWPRELGFDSTRTSTEYFRRLMSDETGAPAGSPQEQLASDLKPDMLSAMGLRSARSAEAFAASNNLWQVVCVGEEAPSATAFLITRNVDLGKCASATSVVRRVKDGPLSQIPYAVWITRGGGVFRKPFLLRWWERNAPTWNEEPGILTAAQLFPSTNETYDVMLP